MLFQAASSLLESSCSQDVTDSGGMQPNEDVGEKSNIPCKCLAGSQTGDKRVNKARIIDLLVVGIAASSQKVS
eukprot:763125-Hanusia_phi.AAC.2